jgi:hypothetical protein
MTNTAATKSETLRAGWRLRLGLAVLIVGFLSPLLIPLVAASGLSVRWKAIVSGALAVGIPEVFSLVAIAIMGKSGFNYIKARFFDFLKKYGPADVVSRTRYRFGLVMFGLPLLFGWLGPYVVHLIPIYETHRIAVGVAGDLMIVASLFVLGGDFWDKVRALFVHGAVAHFPSKT